MTLRLTFSIILLLLSSCACNERGDPPDDPCSLTESYHRFVCDDCGYSWYCSSVREEVEWKITDVDCECIAEDGTRISDCGGGDDTLEEYE